MKLFVTGIAGRLGRAVADEAAKQNIDIVGLDHQPWPDDCELPGPVQTHIGTYEDVDLLEKLLDGCDGIIHTAGPNGEQLETVDLAGFLHLNVTCVATMLETAVKVGINNVALSSTMEVQIGRDWATSGAALIDEDAPPRTDSPYSLSRLLAEQLGQEFARQHGVSIISLRYMGFGYSTDAQMGPRLLARYVSTRDVARAVILGATTDGLTGEVVNIGPKTKLTNTDIAQAITDPHTVLEKHYPGAAAIIDQHGHKLTSDWFWPVVSIRLAKRLLGWEPQYTFEVWLTERGWQPPNP